MFIKNVALTNFRNYKSAEVNFQTEGLTLITGANGQGKTNLLEALSYVISSRSFRTNSLETLIGAGLETAIIRADAENYSRKLLIECELRLNGRNKKLINKQQLRGARDMQDILLATVFSPDDLDLIKGGPANRRSFLDQLSSDSDIHALQNQRDLDRILKQRNTLLKQAGGRLTPDVLTTLDVWDAKFVEAGELLGEYRSQLVEELHPHVNDAYGALTQSHQKKTVAMSLVTTWRKEDGGEGLAAAIAASRNTDAARGVTTLGPHRDELQINIGGFASRTHASQGEQRTLALSLKLGAHKYLSKKVEEKPILLLDDVFSELDSYRTSALISELPPGQTFLTTATAPPEGIKPEAIITISNGEVL